MFYSGVVISAGRGEGCKSALDLKAGMARFEPVLPLDFLNNRPLAPHYHEAPRPAPLPPQPD
jgi:hypothetical protein